MGMWSAEVNNRETIKEEALPALKIYLESKWQAVNNAYQGYYCTFYGSKPSTKAEFIF